MRKFSLIHSCYFNRHWLPQDVYVITLNLKAKIINLSLRNSGFGSLNVNTNGIFEQNDIKDPYFDSLILPVKYVLSPLKNET